MLEGKLASPLAVLRDAAAELNAASTEINPIIADVEEQLVQAQVEFDIWLDSVPVYLFCPNPTAHGVSYPVTELGFGRARQGADWHLLLRTIVYEETHNDEITRRLMRKPFPLAQASRLERIIALRLLPALLEKLTKAVQEATADIRAAKSLIGLTAASCH